MRQATIATDIGYGDAGKGSIVDYLARQADSAVVIRYNGGPQAAHNVITPDGRHHTFAQFGSGSFVPGVRTHLSRYMLVNPLNMLLEAKFLAAQGEYGIWHRLSVDGDAIVVLPWHQAANRLREQARGTSRHGSCGQGVGEARSGALRDPDGAIRVRHLLQTDTLSGRLQAHRADLYHHLRDELGDNPAIVASAEWLPFTDARLIPWMCRMYQTWAAWTRIVDADYLRQLAASHEQFIFEGAQGVLLDEAHGFYPYTTWSDITPANAEALLRDIRYDEPVTRLAVMRAYGTRHGAGPFVTEDPSLAGRLREQHNDTGPWQGAFRYGHLDLLALRYAIGACGGFDGLAITNLDRLAALPDWHVCTAYQADVLPADANDYLEVAPDGSIAALKPGPTADRSYQARLTELLAHCQPRYRTLYHQPGDQPAQEQQLLELVANHLGTPVTLVSHGPTAACKRQPVLC